MGFMLAWVVTGPMLGLAALIAAIVSAGAGTGLSIWKQSEANKQARAMLGLEEKKLTSGQEASRRAMEATKSITRESWEKLAKEKLASRAERREERAFQSTESRRASELAIMMALLQSMQSPRQSLPGTIPSIPEILRGL